MRELITLEEAAERLGIHISTVRSWVRQGLLPSYRLGQRFARVSWEEVVDALAAGGATRGIARAQEATDDPR